MAANDKTTGRLKAGCRLEKVCKLECELDSNTDLFSRKWEVFVIKRDKITGNLVGSLACCALEPV
jgi:hypothetical protein